MTRLLTAACAVVLLASGAAGAAFAQPGYGHHDNGRHEGWDRGERGGDRWRGHWRDDWRPGARIDRDYWRHGDRVDWRRHHLRRPPRGYEWREVDGRYVLAAAATGLIASIIAGSR